MRRLITLGISGVLAGPLLSGQSLAASMTVTIEVPKLDVAEYHKPFVAAWTDAEPHQDLDRVEAVGPADLLAGSSGTR